MKPPANPTCVEKTPGVSQKSRSAPQKHPIPVGGGQAGSGQRVILAQGRGQLGLGGEVSVLPGPPCPGTTHQKSPSASWLGTEGPWGSH